MSRHVANPSRLALAALVLVALAFALAATLWGSSGGSSPSSSAVVTSAAVSGFDGAALPASPAPPFTLPDQNGQQVALGDSAGKVTVIAFLSSTCGAACTLIAQQIRGALDELRQPARVLFVSVDPAADTPGRVRGFLESVALSGRVHYLTGPRRLLLPIWRAYRIRPPSAGRTAFERSASVLLIDRLGRERVVFGQEQLTPESLAHDIVRLDGEPAHP
jgi:protein SCO1